MFRFEPRIHDNGEKTVLGQRIPRGGGMDDGLRVIDILAKHPSTAQFIALKLGPPLHRRRSAAGDRQQSRAKRFARVMAIFPTVLRAIVDSPEFFAREIYQAKMKNPFEFVASALRVTGSRNSNDASTAALLRPHGRTAIFSPSRPPAIPTSRPHGSAPDMLLTRMNFAIDLAGNRLPGAELPPERLNRSQELSTSHRAGLAIAGDPRGSR